MSVRRVLPALMTILLVCSTVFGVQDQQVKGITAQIPAQQFECVAVELATMRLTQVSPQLPHSFRSLTETDLRTMGFDYWIPLDTISSEVRIPPGDRYVLALNPEDGSISEIQPGIELEDYVLEAIERAPRWLRRDLVTNLSNISGDWADHNREMLAELILEADDPYVDEIAFTVAHLSSGLLDPASFRFELLVENAVTIYEADEYLDYVSIIDHGEAGDDDYWSTLEYNIKTADEDTVQLEIDPYFYYWYVVHPRISDEHPHYINPATGNVQGPPNGVFWRDFLLDHPDENYLSLREALEDCGVLWSSLINNGTSENGAVGVVTEWINTILEFNSGNERPIQPVRIYNLHMGRCGEHQDMTVAAGRSALIPTTGVSCWPFDHVWNQFYEGCWMQWEPEGNSTGDSLRYDGGRQIPALFAWRGDGFVETVTPRFSEGVSDLVIQVNDRTRDPVDGAKVMIASEYHHGGLINATWGFTDSEGRVTIKIGDQRNFYLRIDSPIGRYPEGQNQVVQVVTNSEANRVYEWSQRLSGEVPELRIREDEPVEDPLNHFNIAITYTPQGETVAGRIFDRSDFLAGIYPARLDFFICDLTNYEQYLDGDTFDAFNITELTEEGEIEFNLPTDDQWYAVFSNEQRVINLEDVQLDAYWYCDSDWSAPGLRTLPGVPSDYSLSQNFPNPFNATTRIPFALKASGDVKLTLFDLQGREVASLEIGQLSAGFHSVQCDANGLESGVYLYRIECNGFTDAKKMVMVK